MLPGACYVILLISVLARSSMALDNETSARNLADDAPTVMPSGLPSGAPSATPKQPSASPTITKPPPPLNVLIIVSDQLRYDALRFIQDRMPIYNNHLKVNTPNIDRLATQSVYFENAYAQSSVCVPSRGTLRSGCTIERHGLQDNYLPNDGVVDTDRERKLEAIRTYDQMLSSVGYQVESYGKFHLPTRWFYQNAQRTEKAINYTGYSLDFEAPMFSENTDNGQYMKQSDVWMARDGKEKIVVPGQRVNPASNWTYTPIDGPAFPTGDTLFGFDSLPSNYSRATYIGMQGKLAIRRLAKGEQPWCLSISLIPPRKFV